MFFFMLLAYSMVFALLAAVVCHREWGGCYIWAKIVSSLAFFAVFVISARISGQSAVFFRMLPAFLCCFVGDIFMAVYNRTRRKPYFLLGLVIFLGGHLFFVRWLCGMQRISVTDILLASVAVAVACGLCGMEGMHTGRLRPFVLVYTFFVALFFVKAWRLALVNPALPAFLAAVGSALFFVSDISILFLYFWKKKSTAVHLFNLATYYYGVFLLASHLLFL